MTVELLRAEIDELRRRLEEAEDTVRAIRTGAVDAFVVEEPGGNRIYALKSADRPYRLFVEQMQQGAATLHPDGTILYANLRLSEQLGVPHEALVGSRLQQFVDRLDRSCFESLLRQARVLPGACESRLRRSDGRVLPALIAFNNLPEDCGAAIGVLVTDLTLQRHHRELEVSEERYRSLVSVVTDVPWTTDPAGDFVAPQPAWQAFTGQTWLQHAGGGWAKAIHPDDREAVRELWDRACKDGTPYESRGRMWHQPSKSWRRFVARAVPLRAPDGSVREWVGSCTDVEDREALLASERSARAEADRAARLKDEFLAVLSHELRSPLNAIVGYTHLLKSGATDAQTVLQAVDVIERNTTVQTQLIADLLDMSRIHSGKMRLRVEPVDVPTVLDAAIDSIRPAAEGKRITIRRNEVPEGARLYGDSARLQQIVWNLLSNAVKFTPHGGSVRVDLVLDPTEVEIRVADTGEGIEAEFLPHVFDRFRQEDSSSARQHGGLGLGLTLVKQLTELHGGVVSVASGGKGKGATFVVRLPRVLPQGLACGEETLPVDGQVSLDGLSVLVVDDEPDGLEMLRRILDERGAMVATARGTDEALALLSDRPCDVLLSDIGMPMRDGYELIAAVRKRGLTTPAAAVTAYVRQEDLERVHRAGYQAHVGKPIQPERLIQIVAELGRRST